MRRGGREGGRRGGRGGDREGGRRGGRGGDRGGDREGGRGGDRKEGGEETRRKEGGEEGGKKTGERKETVAIKSPSFSDSLGCGDESTELAVVLLQLVECAGLSRGLETDHHTLALLQSPESQLDGLGDLGRNAQVLEEPLNREKKNCGHYGLSLVHSTTLL